MTSDFSREPDVQFCPESNDEPSIEGQEHGFKFRASVFQQGESGHKLVMGSTGVNNPVSPFALALISRGKSSRDPS